MAAKKKPAATGITVKKKATTSSSSAKAKAKPKLASRTAPSKKATFQKTAASKAKEKKLENDTTTPGELGEGSSSSNEGRGAVFRKKPSQKVIEKKDRAMSQRMMLVHRERGNDTSSSQIVLSETFKVLGSTGNVYTVVIDQRPRCDCPDARKNTSDICKHLIFVFLKILKLPETDSHWYQKALTPSELIDIFAKAKPDPTLTNAQLQSVYLVATGQKAAPIADPAESSSSHGRRNTPQSGDGSLCPICYEDFTPGETKGLVFCETSCGNPVHEECSKQWRKSCQASAATCVWCRTVLSQDKKVISSGPSQVNEYGMQYFNLANDSGIDSTRDYSTYSHSCE
jgi:hypothetical protein